MHSAPKVRRTKTKAAKRESALHAGIGDPITGRKQKLRHRWALRQLIARHGGRCALCGELVVLEHDHPRQATVDHVIPRSKGGLDIATNWQLACLSCNQLKGDT